MVELLINSFLWVIKPFECIIDELYKHNIFMDLNQWRIQNVGPRWAPHPPPRSMAKPWWWQIGRSPRKLPGFFLTMLLPLFMSLLMITLIAIGPTLVSRKQSIIIPSVNVSSIQDIYWMMYFLPGIQVDRFKETANKVRKKTNGRIKRLKS